ncbi:MAG: transposase [Limisphaerales bacterium]|jgi:transposase
MKLIRIGVDLAKNVYQLHGVDGNEKPVFKRRLRRDQWLKALFTHTDTDCVIGMEACAGAHHWARLLQSRGYQVVLIPAQFVKPYVKSDKTDANDAEAICEAMSRPNMRFVTVKSVEQQDIQALHRVRAAIPSWLEDAENGLTPRFRTLLHGLWEDLLRLDERVVALDADIAVIAKTDPVAKRLQQLRGVGPLTATALVASIGSGAQYAKGRQMASALGLTPKQHSSGGKERLQGISKRGDVYLRTLLIHGARTVVVNAKDKDDRLSRWVNDLAKRRHRNVVAVALANKTARMAWAMMRSEADYDPEFVAA